MKLSSTLSPRFFATYRHLSPGIRAKARESYRLFVADPASVKFKAIKRLADGSQLLTARLAAWLLEQRGQIVDLPISRFARETGVTETTIVRFCKGVGYSGYRELRLCTALTLRRGKG